MSIMKAAKKVVEIANANREAMVVTSEILLAIDALAEAIAVHDAKIEANRAKKQAQD
jgi:hypothetical protein